MNLKIIIGILVGLLVVQIIGAIIFFTFISNAPPPASSIGEQTNPSSSSAPTVGVGKLLLSTEKSLIKVGETTLVTISLDSGNLPLDGVDVTLKYDPGILEVVRVDNRPFIPGRLFPDTPLNSFNQTQGVATMSAISALDKNFAGSGVLGSISFKAKKSGVTAIRIESTPGNTVDSNVVSDGKEILGETKDVEITVQ